MASKLVSTGLQLERLLARYQQNWTHQFPSATPPSKRMMSKRLVADEHALARWTNDKAHQGLHPGWRVPLKRVLEVCLVLGATDDDRDDIMLARLAELQAANQGEDVSALMSWLWPYVKEWSERPALDGQQRQVLAAFNRVRAQIPGSETASTPLEHESTLEASLRAWFDSALSIEAEQAAHDDIDEDPRDAEMRKEALRKLSARLVRSRPAAPARPPSARDTEAMVRNFRRAMKASGDSSRADDAVDAQTLGRSPSNAT